MQAVHSIIMLLANLLNEEDPIGIERLSNLLGRAIAYKSSLEKAIANLQAISETIMPLDSPAELIIKTIADAMLTQEPRPYIEKVITNYINSVRSARTWRDSGDRGMALHEALNTFESEIREIISESNALEIRIAGILQEASASRRSRGAQLEEHKVRIAALIHDPKPLGYKLAA